MIEIGERCNAEGRGLGFSELVAMEEDAAGAKRLEDTSVEGRWRK